jgi:hypothetical protein
MTAVGTEPASTIHTPAGQRAAGLIGVAAGLLWAALTVWEYRAGLQHGRLAGARLANQIGFTAATVGYLVMLVGLHRARPAGPGRTARVFTGLFASAWLAILAGQFLTLLAGISNEPNPLLPVGGILQAVASIGVGVTVARTGRWAGWQRWWPLVLGGYYVIGLLIPALAGHEPGPVTEPIWGLTYAILGAAVATGYGRP